jgi:uncharacterized protein (TIGR02001 family)
MAPGQRHLVCGGACRQSATARANRIRARACAVFLVVASLAEPAAAQFAARVGIDSDYRLRGYSLTDDRPALSAQFSYDDRSGLYASVLGLAEVGAHNRFLGAIGSAGYAKRVSSTVSLDVGLLRSQIRGATYGARGFDYTEFYAGTYVGPVSGRVSYSPDYRRPGQSTVYGELEAGFEPATDWRVSGHAGMLVYLKTAGFYQAGETHRDWRFSVARRFRAAEVHASLSGGGPSSYYGYRLHKKAAFTVGTSVAF